MNSLIPHVFFLPRMTTLHEFFFEHINLDFFKPRGNRYVSSISSLLPLPITLTLTLTYTSFTIIIFTVTLCLEWLSKYWVFSEKKRTLDIKHDNYKCLVSLK